MKTQRCRKCGEERPATASEFRRNAQRKSGLSTACKKCDRAYNRSYTKRKHTAVYTNSRRWVKANPEKMRIYYRRSMLKTKYGLTEQDYSVMLKAQGGLCAICGRKETALRSGKQIPLSVDHDHKTNQVRELLCIRCNALLGTVNDDSALLLKAIAYLRKHGETS